MTKEECIADLKSINATGMECIDYAIKALEQRPSDDVMAIHTQGLNEGIRCAMCTNSMKSDKGCDGGCVVDNKMYKKVMETIKSQMFKQPTSDDCVSRQAVIEYIKACGAELGHDLENESVREDILNMPSVTPTQRWIPVSERLPEEIGTYLVTLEYKEHGKGITTLWYHGEDIGWDLRVADVVIAWQPLPKPYEEKRSNKVGWSSLENVREKVERGGLDDSN